MLLPIRLLGRLVKALMSLGRPQRAVGTDAEAMARSVAREAAGNVGATKLSHSAAARKAVLEAAGCKMVLCQSQGQGRGHSCAGQAQGVRADARVDIVSLLYELSCLGIRSIMVEGGAQVSLSPSCDCLFQPSLPALPCLLPCRDFRNCL